MTCNFCIHFHTQLLSCGVCGNPVSGDPVARKRAKEDVKASTAITREKRAVARFIGNASNDDLYAMLTDGRLFQAIGSGKAYETVLTSLQAAGFTVNRARVVCGRWDN